MKFKIKRRMSVWRYLALGYALLIFLGCPLLIPPLPQHSAERGTFFA